MGLLCVDEIIYFYSSFQLHMNFISAIHTTAFTVLRNHNEPSADERQQKMLFEQMCEVREDQYFSLDYSLICTIIHFVVERSS